MNENTAPLDPSLVKAGDGVTVESDGGKYTGSVAARTTDSMGRLAWVVMGGLMFQMEGPNAWTLTAHQPAPKPEWKPGTVGTATVVFSDGLLNPATGRRVFRTMGVIAPGKTRKPWVDEFGNVLADAEVADFVPDEARPEVTRKQVEDILRQHMSESPAYARNVAASDLLALLRGVSR